MSEGLCSSCKTVWRSRQQAIIPKELTLGGMTAHQQRGAGGGGSQICGKSLLPMLILAPFRILLL